MKRRMLLAVLALLPAAGYGEQAWVKATSANFEVYTTAGEQKAREAVRYFEDVDGFFQKAFGATRPGRGRVRVIAFESAREYRPYQPSEGRLAYAGGGPDMDQIVMQKIGPEQYFIAVHEYVHILLKPFPKVPLWFNEGLAQVYSTLRPVGGKVVVGDPLPGALDMLKSAHWPDLDTLCAVDANSPYYTAEASKASVFYAESWLLTHMLFLGKKYGFGFAEFKRQTLAGTPADEAFESAFGKTLWHVYTDLCSYAEDGEFRGPAFDVAVAKSAANPEVKPVTAFESGLVLASALVDSGQKDDARKALRKLAAENPSSPEPAEAFGYLALREGDHREARTEFAKAIDLGSKHARVYFRLYALAAQAGEPHERQVALLRKALELEPEFRDARLHLGYLLLAESDYAGALAEFSQVKEGDPERPYRFFYALAYASYRAGDEEAARANAKRAAEAARGTEEKAFAEQLLAMVEGRPAKGAAAPAPPEFAEGDAEMERRPTIRHRDPGAGQREPRGRVTIEGTLDRIDCMGKAASLRMIAGGRTVQLLIDRPESIEVRGGQAGAFNMTCGPQQSRPKVLIEYEPQVDDDVGTIGLVRAIEMK